MGHITEDFARRMIENGSQGRHTPLTCWEEVQLAYSWMILNRCPIETVGDMVITAATTNSAGASGE